MATSSPPPVTEPIVKEFMGFPSAERKHVRRQYTTADLDSVKRQLKFTHSELQIAGDNGSDYPHIPSLSPTLALQEQVERRYPDISEVLIIQGLSTFFITSVCNPSCRCPTMAARDCMYWKIGIIIPEDNYDPQIIENAVETNDETVQAVTVILQSAADLRSSAQTGARGCAPAPHR